MIDLALNRMRAADLDRASVPDNSLLGDKAGLSPRRARSGTICSEIQTAAARKPLPNNQRSNQGVSRELR